MKTKININGKEVEIELTAEQIKAIKKATTDYKDIKSFEDACAFENVDIAAFNSLVKDLPDDIAAYMKLRIIVKAINGGKSMDFKNTNENKYYPWFNAAGSVSGFSYYYYYYVDGCSSVSSRLCFIDSKRAEYAGKQFLSIYNEYINTN
ncbi:hypothetical protein [Pedobacter sp.]